MKMSLTLKYASIPALLGGLLLAATSFSTPGAVERVSTDGGGVQGSSASYPSSISSDGRYVAFVSSADNLVAGDTNSRADVFRKDRTTGVVDLASSDPAGLWEVHPHHDRLDITRNGQFIAFRAAGYKKVGGAFDYGNAYNGIFVKDLSAGTLKFASIASNGAKPDGDSYNPSISDNGQFVAYGSYSTNLASGDTNGSDDVFVKDLTAGTNTKISQLNNSTGGDSASYAPRISGDGRYVAFISYAGNLVAGDTNGALDIFVKDRTANTMERVSHDSTGAMAFNVTSINYWSWYGIYADDALDMSGDGRYVAFTASTTVDDGAGGSLLYNSVVVVKDRTAGTFHIASTLPDGTPIESSYQPSINGTGRYVSFITPTNATAWDTNQGYYDVYVKDRTAGALELASVPVSAYGNAGQTTNHYFNDISDDGQLTAFPSDSPNLVSGDTNGQGDIFVHANEVADVTTGPFTTATLSGGTQGTNGWFTSDVTVTLHTTDYSGTGIKNIFWRKNGSAFNTYTVPFVHSTEQNALYEIYAEDNAGNVEAVKSFRLKLDETAPTISINGTLPDNSAYTSGTWVNQDVTIHSTCSDALSGISTTNPCPADYLVNVEHNSDFQLGVYDQAGHYTVSNIINLKIDKTPPTITRVAKRADNTAYSNGTWTNQTVNVTYPCSDALSGISGSCPAAESFSADGTYTPQKTVTDLAGNQASSPAITIKIDKTAPTLTVTATKADGSAYTSDTWTNQTVTLNYTCSDAGSGLSTTCPAQVVLSAEGTHTITRSASDSVVETPKNTSTNTFIVKIDKTAPTITASATKADGSAYTSNTFANQNVTVSYTCGDTGGSGIVCPAAQTFSADGTTSVNKTLTDGAGNSTTSNTIVVKIDKTAPTITASAKKADNSNYTSGTWTNQNVTVSFICSDSGSGLAANCPNPVTVSSQGTVTVSRSITDNAGNSSTSAGIQVRIDKTAPTITAAATKADNSAYTSGTFTNQNVTVSFTCGDTGGSGLPANSCPAPVTVSAEGTASVSQSVSDGAGNSTTSTAIEVKIDKTAPTITLTTPSNGATYLTNQAVAASYSCSDASSGVASCTGTVASGANIDTATTGAKSFTVGATDSAGNTTNQNVGYTVVNPVNNAAFVAQTVPATMVGGMRYTVLIRMTNTGNTTWTGGASYGLGVINPVNNANWQTKRAYVPEGVSVAPGQSYTFGFKVKAPATGGTYNFQWKMLREGVGWFGQETANLPVTVLVNDAAFVSQVVPARMAAGLKYTVKLTFQNTGTTTWNEGTKYRLGVINPIHPSNWTYKRAYIVPVGTNVAPGQSYTFTFQVVAPATEGSYNFEWRMLQDGNDWFGQASTPLSVPVDRYAAAFVSQTVPAAMTPGQTYPVSVTLTNTGSTTWTAGELYGLGSQNPQNTLTWGKKRVAVPAGASIAPGQSHTFNFNVTAPSTPGTYNFQWQMLREGVNWFGDKTTNVAVTVQ